MSGIITVYSLRKHILRTRVPYAITGTKDDQDEDHRSLPQRCPKDMGKTDPEQSIMVLVTDSDPVWEQMVLGEGCCPVIVKEITA